MPPILSHYQTETVLRARREGAATVTVSLDLNRSTARCLLTDAGLVLPDGATVDWAALDTIERSDNACFSIADGMASPIREFSETTNRACSLMPTETAPTMLLGGFFMHRIKGTDPMKDTASKLDAVRPVRGSILDTATGLGYTAIAAARTADQVTTIEVDPAVLRLARQNPWSDELFENARIRRIVGDASEEIEAFRDDSFDAVVHDPPVISLGGELYSAAFYRELLRVLRPGGRLFHYIGNLASESGARTGKGVARRLHDAGFVEVRAVARSFGYAARKAR